LKLSIEVDGESCSLEWRPNGTGFEYVLSGAASSSGDASVSEVMPGVFSVLLGTRSFTVHVGAHVGVTGDQLEVWSGSQCHLISVADTRDRSDKSTNAAATGPIGVRAQMPGRVVKVLVELGARVEAGQGLIVVEAMKMQNEMKAIRAGRISKIHVAEGATVAAGESLIVVE
jgi:acetyl/propionyl-CoA carboxylase alpha subunit